MYCSFEVKPQIFDAFCVCVCEGTVKALVDLELKSPDVERRWAAVL